MDEERKEKQEIIDVITDILDDADVCTIRAVLEFLIECV